MKPSFELLNKNILANYGSQVWSAAMGLAFIPLYIKLIGIEAYGLVGFFALLQAWMGLLDAGLSPTISREIARSTASSLENHLIKDLIKTIEVVVYIVGGVSLVVIALSSEWISSRWINAKSLTNHEVNDSVKLMGLVIAARLVEGVYRSSIVGLQKQVVLSLLIATLSTLRAVGCLIVLVYIDQAITAFFIWQAIVSILTIVVYKITLAKLLPDEMNGGEFSIKAIVKIKKFAGGMLGMSLMSLLLTQADKVILSKILSLQEFGYYTLAVIISSSLYMLVAPIAQALMPVIVQLKQAKRLGEMVEKFHFGSQLDSILAGNFSLLIVFQSVNILMAWTNDMGITSNTAPILSVLSLGFFFNIMMWMPHETLLAHGNSRLPFFISIFQVAIILPSLIVIVPSYGAVGAAYIWLMLCAGYFFIGSLLIFPKIYPIVQSQWLATDLFKPLLPSFLMLMAVDVLNYEPKNVYERLVFLILIFMSMILMSIMSAGLIRRKLMIAFNIITYRNEN